MKIKTLLLLTAASAALMLASCAGKDSSSSAVTTAATTASAAAAPAPADGKPGGKYIFTHAFKKDGQESFLSVDIDPSNVFISFDANGKGTSSTPGGTSNMTWDETGITIEGGSKNSYTLEGDKLTVKEGDMTIEYVHESTYKDPNGIPDGKYAFVRGHNDGEPIDFGDSVTAENTYLEFYNDGTGNASSASGKQGFKWEKGHITYSDGTDSTYILRGTTLTVFEIQSTVIMEKVADKDV